MRAAIYARFSTDKQSDNSIEDQGRNCERYAERFDMQIVARFEDRAISGASTERPGYQAMLAAAKRKEFDVLLADDLSRLSRDEIEIKKTIRYFKYWGSRIIGVSDGYDSATKGEKIQSTMRGLMNEMYLDDLRDKTWRGLLGKATHGYSAGGRSYGYKRMPIESATKIDANGRPEIEAVERAIDENEVKWVVQIFEWFAEGHSAKWIASKLNELNVPSPRGGTWTTSTVYGDTTQGNGFLNNQLYIGRYIWNRSMWIKNPDTGRRTRIARPETEWMIKEMPELRIVPQELWEAVQTRLRDIRSKSGALREALNNPNSRCHTGKYLFSGLLKCGCCGANFIMCGKRTYGCANNINRGNSVCSNRLRVPRKIVEERLIAPIREELFSDEAIALFVQETTRLLKQKQNEKAPEYDAAKRDLARTEKEIANIMNAIKQGIVTPATKTELERAESERARLQCALQADTAASGNIADILPNAKERYKDLLSRLGETLYRDVAHARKLIETLIGAVSLVPQTGGFLEAQMQPSLEGLGAILLNNDEKFLWLRGEDLNL